MVIFNSYVKLPEGIYNICLFARNIYLGYLQISCGRLRMVQCLGTSDAQQDYQT